MALLDVRSVSKNFGAVRSSSDVSFTGAAGEVVDLIGRRFLPRRILAVFGFSGDGEDVLADTGFGWGGSHFAPSRIHEDRKS